MLSLVSLRDLTLLRQLLPQYAGQPGNTNPEDRTLALYTTECSRKTSFQNIHVQLSELPQRELEVIQHVLPTIFDPPPALELDTTVMSSYRGAAADPQFGSIATFLQLVA